MSRKFKFLLVLVVIVLLWKFVGGSSADVDEIEYDPAE